MPRITVDEVARIAVLARLSLSDDEVRAMAHDLDQFLDYVSQLQSLDTTRVEPTAHAIPLPPPLREDRAIPGIDPELALANAPERAGTAFVVPKVIEGEEEG